MEITELCKNVSLKTHFWLPTEAKQGPPWFKSYYLSEIFFTVLIVRETFMKCLINTFHIFEIFTLLPIFDPQSSE